MTQNPPVTVIMSNYNTPLAYLKEAVDSILNQTLTDFQLILIDDGSTDDSPKYLQSISDERVELIFNNQNRGLPYCKNIGMDAAKGKYVAMMDTDDISLPTRLEKQAAYMEAHPDVIVCGTWAEFFSESGSFLHKPVLEDSETTRISLLFGNKYLVHPSVMINRALFEAHHLRYQEEFITAQDYRLWADCARAGEIAVLPEVLLRYRLHDRAISARKRDIQQKLTVKTIQYQLDRLHYTLTEEKLAVYPYTFNSKDLYDPRTKTLLKELLRANRRYRVYNQKSFKRYLYRVWAKLSAAASGAQKNVLKKAAIALRVPPCGWVYYAKAIVEIRRK